jgi:cyclophilin family peptidyl-prolyl cis-trans isomerase
MSGILKLFITVTLIINILTMFTPRDNGRIIKFEKNNKEFEKVTHKVFIDIKVGDEEPRRIEIVLFGKTHPKAAENFRLLCTGEKGYAPDGTKLHYKGSKVFELMGWSFMSFGDFKNNNKCGVGALEPFYPESFQLGHIGSGYISMIPSRLEKTPDYGKINSIFQIMGVEFPMNDDYAPVIGKVLFEDDNLWLLNNIIRKYGDELAALVYSRFIPGKNEINARLPVIEIVDSGELSLNGNEDDILNPNLHKKTDL